MKTSTTTDGQPTVTWVLEAKFKELTDEEILEIANQFEEGVAFSDSGWSIPSEDYLGFARAILRKAQEK